MISERPLTPVDCDLRSFPYMPVYIDRLLGGDFFTQANDAEFRAGFVLYLKSFREVPAGSLPNDNRSLTRLAELGQDVAKLKRIKPVALRGWTCCSDGRLYHPVVATVVLEAWLERLKARRKGVLGNAKRWSLTQTVGDVDEQIATACRHLILIDPSATPSGIPPTILVRSKKDAENIAQGHPSAIASIEAIPTGYPSQVVTPRGVVPLTRTCAREDDNLSPIDERLDNDPAAEDWPDLAPAVVR